MNTQCIKRGYSDIHAKAPPTYPSQSAVAQAEALIAQWDTLPLRDRAAVKDRLQAIVGSLAAIVLAGNRLDGVWPGSALDTLVNAEVTKVRAAQSNGRSGRKTA